MAYAFYNQTSGKFVGCSDANIKLFMPISSILHIVSKPGEVDGVEFVLSSGQTEQFACNSDAFLLAYKNFLNE